MFGKIIGILLLGAFIFAPLAVPHDWNSERMEHEYAGSIR